MISTSTPTPRKLLMTDSLAEQVESLLQERPPAQQSGLHGRSLSLLRRRGVLIAADLGAAADT
jgi:hypothetical protein